MANYRPQPNWRDHYNPLRGLTMARIVSMEEAANRGDLADLQWFWHHMVQTDVTVASAVAKRLSHINSLDWEIRLIETADPYLAQEQADVLRYAYDRIDNLKEAAEKLVSGIFAGFAMLEKVRTGYGPLIARLEHIPPWYWIHDAKGKRWYFNPESKPGLHHGQTVDDRDLVTFHPGDPLFKSIGRHFFSKQLALADWDIALENGANQAIFVVGPPGTTPEKEEEYMNLAEKLTSNMRGYVPNGTDIKITDLAARSKMPYFERIDYADKQIVMAATGGLLTMLTESGSGTLAGNAHSDTLMGLARADAAKISEVFQKNIDKEILRAFFPGQPVAAYFQFDLPQPAETRSDIIEAASNLSWSGYRISKEQLEEKLGLKLEFIDPSQEQAGPLDQTQAPPVDPQAAPMPDASFMPNRAPLSERQRRFLFARGGSGNHSSYGGSRIVGQNADPEAKAKMREDGWIGSSRPHNAPELPLQTGGSKGGASRGTYSGGGATIVKRSGPGNMASLAGKAPKADPFQGRWLAYLRQPSRYGGNSPAYVHNDINTLRTLKATDPVGFANLLRQHPNVMKGLWSATRSTS